MPSRLSSLLVRDGLVGVKRMEHAFQRQVIYGGCLDTILLEMNLVPEERLVQYLSLATGLPPATRSEMDVFDAEAVTKCPVDAARAFRVVPLCFEEGALRVVVHDPVDLALLEELANDLEFPVQPLVVPEYRFHLVFARTYGGTPNARFVALAKRAEESSPTPPVGKARTVIIDEAPAQPQREFDDGSEIPAESQADYGPQGQPQAGFDSELENQLEYRSAQQFASDPDSEFDTEPDHHVVDVGVPPVVRLDDDRSSQFDEAPTMPRGRAITGAHEELATATTEPVPMPPPEAAQAIDAAEPVEPAGRGARRAQPRETILGVGLPGTGSFVPMRRPLPAEIVDDAPSGSGIEESQFRKVVTAPIGSRNAPSGEDRVIGSAPAAQPAQPVSASAPVGGDLAGQPLSAAQARVELSVAEDRDLIFGLLLRALHHHAWYAGLLTVQGGAAIGRVAIVGSQIDREGVGGVLIPLDVASAFHDVVESGAPRVGPIATGDPEIDSMIQRMGGVVPDAALLLPVVLRDRVVAIAVAHDRDQPLDVAALTELFPLANMAADAILRLLVKAKAASKAQMALNPNPVRVSTEPGSESAPEPAPPSQRAPESEPEPLPPPPAATERRPAAQPMAQPATPATVDERPATQEISIEADEPDPIDLVLDVIEGDDAELAAEARAEALRRLSEVEPALAVRFPGRLLVDRYELGGRVLPASQHGPLLALIVELGESMTDLLIAKMADSKHEVRYYATLCAEELRPRAAIEALVERLFDSDYGTRNAAISALSGYPPGDLDKGLVRARHALHSENATRIQAAANAVARLADISAIPDLLDAVARGDKGSDHARRALVQLTAHDSGTSARKWRAWWSKHKEQHRIEWLIEGLGYKDANIRRAAVEELRKLTGEFFDYNHEAGKRDREAARRRWADWWNAVGRSRYTRGT